MIKGNGRANNISNEFSNLVSYYNNSSYNNTNYYYLWYHGYFDRNQKKWIFPLKVLNNNSLHSTSWSTIFGKMIPDEEAGKFDYEFDLTGLASYKINSFPNAEGSSSTSAQTFQVKDDTAEILKHICLGDYWRWLEEQQQGN